jgi:hypothetical protein
MTDHRVDLAAFLSGASIDAAVAALRPDYRALLIAVDGFDPHTDKNGSEALLVRAEETARDLLAETPVEELPHVAAWRRTGRSAPSGNAPKTASRHWCVAPAPLSRVCRG